MKNKIDKKVEINRKKNTQMKRTEQKLGRMIKQPVDERNAATVIGDKQDTQKTSENRRKTKGAINPT